MHSIITFSERCTLKKVEVKSSDISVINRNDVYGAVAAICGKIENPLLNEEQIAAIYEKLYLYTQVDAAAKAQHIENIEKKLDPVPAQVQTQVPICPRCGGVLVLQTASRGANGGNQFYGCSNYPKCRFVKNQSMDEVQL